MDLEEDRNIQTSHLYKNERKFLAGSPDNEDLDSEEKNKAKRNILNDRLSNLPQRIQYLVDDIALLHAGGFLDSDYCSDEWAEILNIQPREQLKRRSKFVDSHAWTPNTQLKNEVRLGYTIGDALRSLTSMTDSEIDFNELGWGLILGIFGEPRSDFKTENKNIGEFIQYIIDQRSYKEEREDDIEHIMEMDYIEEDLAHYPSLYSQVNMAERVDKIQQARDEYIHAEGNPELGYLGVIEQIIDDSIISVNQTSDLIMKIRQSIKLVNNSQSGGLLAKEVLQEIWETENKRIYRDDIKEKRNASKKQVTEIMNNLGDNPSSKKWKNEPPLVNKFPNDRVNKQWELTNFGYIIGYAMFEEDGMELVQRAIGQIITKQHTQYTLHTKIEKSVEKELLG